MECWNRGELLQAGLKVSSIDELLEETLRRWGEPAAIVCAHGGWNRCGKSWLRVSIRAVRWLLGVWDSSTAATTFGSSDRLSGWVRPPSQELADALGP